MKVYFCGMIGSGKTTIGVPLARQMGLDFDAVDLIQHPDVLGSLPGAPGFGLDLGAEALDA